MFANCFDPTHKPTQHQVARLALNVAGWMAACGDEDLCERLLLFAFTTLEQAAAAGEPEPTASLG